MATTENNGWTPISKPGGIYCSPRCGFNCKKAQHDDCQRKAAELAQRMGPEWIPYVWENGRWNWAAYLREVRTDATHVSPTIDYQTDEVRAWTCYMNSTPKQFIGDHKTDPVEAYRQAVEAAIDFRDELSEEIARLPVI